MKFNHFGPLPSQGPPKPLQPWVNKKDGDCCCVLWAMGWAGVVGGYWFIKLLREFIER